MPTLVVDRRGASLDAEQGRLVVRVAGERVSTLPLRSIDRLIVGPSATLSTRLLGRLGQQGTGLLVLAGRRGRPSVRLPSRMDADTHLRLAQYALLGDEARRTALSRTVVGEKIVGQRDVVEKRRGQSPATRRAVSALARALQRAGAPTVDRAGLRGIEGAAARAYFDALAATVPKRLGFTGRTRRPPRDPLNAAFSFGYTLLYAEAEKAAEELGFDPAIGFFHDVAHGRAALACDVVEPLRPSLDRWVLTAFDDGTLRPEGFTTNDSDGCRLGKTARSGFFRGFEAAAPPWRRDLRTRLADLKRQLVGTAPAPEVKA